MSAGGSALPCATPSSAPMPSFSICSRSRTSHSNWYSEAIWRAASATFEGVSRLAGSFTSPRVKFCASASMRPRASSVLEFRPAAGRRHRERFHGFLVVVGLVAVRFELAQNGALHGRRGILAVRMTRIERQGDRLHRFRFQMPHRRAGHLAHLGRVELFQLPRSGQQHARGGHPRRTVQQRQFQGLSGHFAGVHQISGAEARFLPAFEDQHNQCAGLNLFQGLAFNRNPHHYRL